MLSEKLNSLDHPLQLIPKATSPGLASTHHLGVPGSVKFFLRVNAGTFSAPLGTPEPALNSWGLRSSIAKIIAIVKRGQAQYP